MARDLLNRANENIGLDQKIWVVTETGGFGTSATGGAFPASTDAMEHVSAKLDYNIPRDDAAHRSGRSKVTRLSGKKDVKFSLESYIVPSDPDGSSHPVLPDAHPLLLSAFGAYSVADVTKIIYSLARAGSYSLRLLEEGTHFSRLAVGCVADTVTFSLPGDGKAMLKFDGFGQDMYSCGQSLLASGSTGVHTLTVTTGQGPRFEVGGYADVIAASDGTTVIAGQRQITARTGDVLTLSGAVFTAITGDYVIGSTPTAYTATSSENALLGLKGTFSTANLGTIDADLLSAEISVKNNYSARTNSYGKSAISGFLSDKRREVHVKLDVLLTKDNWEFYSNNRTFTADNVTITLAPQDIPAPSSNAALGRTFTFNLPRVEFNVPALEQPADGALKLTLDGIALSTNINTQNAEMTLQIS